jgi:hypothetical protein
MRKGGSPLRGGEPSHVSHRAQARRSTSEGRAARGCAFLISTSILRSCSLNQGCSSAFVVKATPLARRRPVAGRKRVRCVAVPPRSSSCRCKAG